MKKNLLHSLYRGLKIFALGGASILISNAIVVLGVSHNPILTSTLVLSGLAFLEKFINSQLTKVEESK